MSLLQEDLQLGAEDESFVIAVVIQRFDSEAVSREEEYISFFVEDAECELAIEAFEHIGAPLFIAVNEHFGISMRYENVALLFKRFLDFGKIEYLAVEGYADGAILVIHWLATFFGEVDNFKPFVPDRYAVFDVETFLFRAAMIKQLGERPDLFFVFPVEAEDSAHLRYSLEDKLITARKALGFYEFFQLKPPLLKKNRYLID